MKIRENGGLNRVWDVYAFYWVNGIRYHLVNPYREYQGLIVVPENKCTIVISSIDGFVLRKNDRDQDMLVHWSVSDYDLLDRLIDPPDEEAMLELERRLKHGPYPEIDVPKL